MVVPLVNIPIILAAYPPFAAVPQFAGTSRHIEWYAVGPPGASRFVADTGDLR